MESRVSKPADKIAAFDLDYTLLRPKGKNKFPKSKDDATPVYPEVASKLQELQINGYKIIIFTNQNGIGKRISVEDIYYKIDTYLPNGAAIDVYISYQKNQYRKPFPGMFDVFMENNGPLQDIFYVGDAAGRKGDFSASDAQFAYNCGMPFYTPEQFFLNQKECVPTVPHLKPPKPIPLKGGIPIQTVLILVGPPGCGKSTLAAVIAERYPGTIVINNDDTGSAAKSVRLFRQALKDKAPRIVIDNTNATVVNRAFYVEPAKDEQYKVYAITIGLSKEHASYLNYYRAYTNGKDLIPEVAYRSFYKRLEPIQTSEDYNKNFTYVPKLPEEIFEYSF